MAAAPKLHTNENPLWKGPCGDGELGGITQSMIVRFLSCRERFRLKYMLGLEPHDKWYHTFGYGNMWHCCEEGLAAEVRNFGEVVGTTLWGDNLLTHVKEQNARYPFQSEEIYKWYNVCKVQFPEYVKYWAEHPDVHRRVPLLQEQVFDVPYKLPSGRVVRLRGKWDSVDFIPAHSDGSGQYYPDGVWLQENKTKGDIDKSQVERQLQFDLQTMLYLIALEEYQKAMDKTESSSDLSWHPILGVRYNVVRRPLSGGVGNIKPHKARSTSNKYVPAEGEEEFYERLRRDYIAANPSHWFFRVKVGISERDLKVFRETCLDPLLETVCSWYECITQSQLDRALNERWRSSSMHYRTPFGVYSALEEGGATEYDAYLATGSEVGLRCITTLFPEL